MKGCDFMELNQNLTYMWSFCMGRKNRSKYIPNDAIDTYKISSAQKNSAKKAIVWLLTKASHTVEEIADHYDMSTELVSELLQELISTKIVAKVSCRPARYKINNKTQSNNTKTLKTN